MSDFIYKTAFSSWYRRDGSGLPDEASAEYRAAMRVWASGRLTMGAETEAFEAEIAAYHGRRHAIAVNSGSSANLVAVAALQHEYDIPYRDENTYRRTGHAAIPAIAWATTYAPLVQYSFDLITGDVDDGWNAGSDEKYGWRGYGSPDLYIACSILGNPAPLENITKSASMTKPRLVLEDNCESMGARHEGGRFTGTFGDLSTGSGFWSHQLSAVELGWVLTDDNDLARRCRLLRNHGNAGWGYEDFESKYSFQIFGYNLRPIEAHCAVAREQLRTLDENNKWRLLNARYFRQQTWNLPIVHQQWAEGSTPAPFGLAFECESREARRRLVEALRAEGIDSRLPTGGSFLKHAYGSPWRDQKTPRADLIHERGLFLGNAPYEIAHLIDRAVAVMRGVL